jgi:hypothetical protein
MSKEFTEWLKVSEIANLMGLSRVSVYNRVKLINSKTLQPLQKVDKGITYYNIKVLDLLQPKEQNEQEKEQPKSRGNHTEDYINSLLDQIEFLKEQLTTKDRLLENMQILLKDKQPEVKLLEEEKPIEEKKGFFKRIFSK